jgi:hypothetical protein
MKPRAQHRKRASRAVRGAVVGAFVSIGASLLYAGCSSTPAPATPATKTDSGGAQPSAVPGMPGELSSTAPRTLGEAETELADAERQLDAIVGTTPSATPLSSDACDVACMALSSMRNATAHLCELATDEPARCDDAKARLDRATTRVNDVCPACAGT